MAVKIFVTGGTIDDLEYDSEGETPTKQESIIPQLLKDMRVTLECDVEVLMFKDSKFITDEIGNSSLKNAGSVKKNT